MPKIIELCDDLIPKKVPLNNHRSITDIIEYFIKKSEKNFPYNRQHVKKMTPFHGSSDVCLQGTGDFGFFNTIFESYNNHWGLKTIPDDWWHTIIKTISIAIDKNSNKIEVRKFIVHHEDQKRLTVRVDDAWGINYEQFFNDMSNSIQSNIRIPGYVDTIRSDFSTSTSTHRIASEITVMASMQTYFEYCMRTDCGIPFVEILGKAEDWKKMKKKLMCLKALLDPIHELIGLTDWWERIGKICDKLIQSVEGKADINWWGQIFSCHENGFGSGASVTYDGWFLKDMLNISGAVETFDCIPSGLVSVSIIFDHMGLETKGAVVSGVAGFAIDDSKDIATVSATHGWAIFQ